MGAHGRRHGKTNIVLRDGRVLHEQRWIRSRQAVTAVLVAVGILAILGPFLWGLAAVRGV
jgi:hypothetical protein